MLNKQFIKDCCAKSWNMEVLFGILWDTIGLQEEWEKARNYTFEEGSMTDILLLLNWESLKKRMTDNRLILLYKGEIQNTYR